LRLVTAMGTEIPADDLISEFAAAIRSGRIGAIKGLGGYHLACDARAGEVVAELRRRKGRDEKPFAVMVRDLEAAEELCEVEMSERDLLLSSRRPIVLLRRRSDARIASEAAPGNPYLGLMLPYTPIHHLLFSQLGEMPLVMTSGNRSDEPIAYDDADARNRLTGIADIFLVHDRAIHVRCDDSVTRWIEGSEQPIRRSRGDAPLPVQLPFDLPCPTLAVGGQFKGTFALGEHRRAILSHHLGDLDHFDAYQAFVRDIGLYEQLFAIRPQVLVHDLHPDYASTRYARTRAQSESLGVSLLAVQHHHAHLASCMAEHGLTEPVIGVVFDGTGYGTDGAVWGGEFLVGDYRQFSRAGHLRYVGMAGGDRAVREPWRMALSHRRDAGVPTGCSSVAIRTVTAMLEKRINCPMTSSMGRIFDAVACIAGLRDLVSYEGQAAVELEWAATGIAADAAYPFDLAGDWDGSAASSGIEIDTRPIIRAVVADADRGAGAGRIARRFHSTIVEIVENVCRRIRLATGNGIVVISGGVFMNALLTQEVAARLRDDGFQVYRHCRVPPNDGGLSLGQLAVAAAF
jgi:hydrogenase maturation protein HypF